MSLILEALKKSERQRRRGEAPVMTAPLTLPRRKRSLLPFFAVAIVAALGAGWWLLREPAAPAPAPRSVASEPITVVPPAKPIDTAPPGAEKSATHDEEPPTPSRRAQHAAKPAAAKNTAAKQAANEHADTIPAQPGPDGQHPGSVTLPPNPPPMVSGPAPKPAARTPADSTAAEPKPAATHKAAATSPASAKPDNAAPPAPAPAAPPPAATAANTPPPAPAAPALPSVWDLPYSTRKDLPDLTLTMHVYSSDPHARFVIIKGDRHVEGDSLDGGVKLREIRADGIVLDFHGQHFLYPRDGR